MSKAGTMAAVGVVWMVAVALLSVAGPFGAPWWYDALFFLIGLFMFLLAFPARRAEAWWHQKFD